MVSIAVEERQSRKPPAPPESCAGFSDGSCVSLDEVSEIGADESVRADERTMHNDSWCDFWRSLPGLPASCRRFLYCTCVAVALILAHAIVVLAAASTVEPAIRQYYNFYGISQALLATLALYFAVFSLRRENHVEIKSSVSIHIYYFYPYRRSRLWCGCMYTE